MAQPYSRLEDSYQAPYTENNNNNLYSQSYPSYAQASAPPAAYPPPAPPGYPAYNEQSQPYPLPGTPQRTIFSRHSTLCICPNCGEHMMTQVYHEAGLCKQRVSFLRSTLSSCV